MGRPKKINNTALEETGYAGTSLAVSQNPKISKVQPITQEFGNGDLNVLRDKINEIIVSN